MRLDALWRLTYTVGWIRILSGNVLATLYLRMALAHGEPSHAARALANEALLRVIRRFEDTTSDDLFARVKTLCDSVDDPSITMFAANAEGNAAFLRWDLSLAREKLEQAEQLGSGHCLDHPWLLIEARRVLCIVWGYQGEHARLIARSEPWRAEARYRGDRFALATLEGLGFGFLRYLIQDDPDRAYVALATSMAPWPNEIFTYAHYAELFAISHIEFYRGGMGSYKWLSDELPRLKRAIVLKHGLGRASFLRFRAFADLCAWTEAPATLAPSLLKETQSLVRQLYRMRLPIAVHSALLLDAQLDVIRGRTEEALEKTRRLAQTEVRNRWFLHPQAAYLEGLLEGGDQGRSSREAALAFFAQQGWKKPRRAVAIYCPIIDWLEAR